MTYFYLLLKKEYLTNIIKVGIVLSIIHKGLHLIVDLNMNSYLSHILITYMKNILKSHLVVFACHHMTWKSRGDAIAIYLVKIEYVNFVL